MIKDQLSQALLQSLTQAAIVIGPKLPGVEYASQEDKADLTTNAALALAKTNNQRPDEIASDIIKCLNQDENIQSSLASTEVASPGFINFRLTTKALWHEAQHSSALSINAPVTVGKTVMVEFSSPNIAKPFNVGHLRSTIIGDSLARIYRHLGYTVLTDNHLGDWGTQYGKLAYAVEQWGDWEIISQNPIAELFKLYVRFHQEEEKNPDLTICGQNYFKKLEDGEPETLQLWQQLVELSLRDFSHLYEQIGVSFDTTLGESFYEPMLADVIAECIRAGLARESDGALLVFFDDDPELVDFPLMIRKSNGTSTYGTRDLAGIKYRMNRYRLSKLVIEIGNEQQLYFKQVIRAAEKIGWISPGQVVHVGHGLFTLPSGKMSTRKGQTVWLSELINEVIDRAKKVILVKNKSITGPDLDSIAQTIAIGALKYNDLSQNRQSNIVFNRDKSLSLEGNSAPYLQYTYVRGASILNAAQEVSPKLDVSQLLTRSLAGFEQVPLTSPERSLLLWLGRFDDAINQAAESYLPSIVAGYLFELAQRFNAFYHAGPILQAPTEQQRHLRLALVVLTTSTLRTGLSLLGIGVPAKM
jgi:arginyl-tRNA synthetase